MMMATLTAEKGREEQQKANGGVEGLLGLAAKGRIFRSADGRFHAQVPVGERQDLYGLRSPAFRDWLIEGYRCERAELPPSEALSRVVEALEARAQV